MRQIVNKKIQQRQVPTSVYSLHNIAHVNDYTPDHVDVGGPLLLALTGGGNGNFAFTLQHAIKIAPAGTQEPLRNRL